MKMTANVRLYAFFLPFLAFFFTCKVKERRSAVQSGPSTGGATGNFSEEQLANHSRVAELLSMTKDKLPDCAQPLYRVFGIQVCSNASQTFSGETCTNKGKSGRENNFTFHGAGFQCVELINRYLLARYNVPTYSDPREQSRASQRFGDARSHYNSYSQDKLGTPVTSQLNGEAGFDLQAGDILTMQVGSFGHIGIVAFIDESAGEVYLAHQNWVPPLTRLKYRIDPQTGAWTVDKPVESTIGRVEGRMRLESPPEQAVPSFARENAHLCWTSSDNQEIHYDASAASSIVDIEYAIADYIAVEKSLTDAGSPPAGASNQ